MLETRCGWRPLTATSSCPAAARFPRRRDLLAQLLAIPRNLHQVMSPSRAPAYRTHRPPESPTQCCWRHPAVCEVLMEARCAPESLPPAHLPPAMRFCR